MTSPPSSRTPYTPQSSALQATQVLYASLGLGVAIFAIVAAFIGQPQVQPAAPGTPPQTQPDSILFLAMLAVWPATTLASFVVPVFMTRKAAMDWSSIGGGDEFFFNGRFQLLTIMRGALLEGGGLFACCVAFIDGDRRALIFAGITVLLFIVTFPTKGALARFAERVTGGRLMDPRDPAASLHADPRRNPR